MIRTNNRNTHNTKTNLKICFSDKTDAWISQTTKATLIENSKTFLETPWLWRNSSYALSKLSGDIINEHLLRNATNREQGTIFVTPHFGSWEYVGLLTAAHCDLMIMYAPPKLPYLHQMAHRGRGSTGATLIETTAGSFKTLIQHLKRGGAIGVLPDQVPTGGGGVHVPFFGRLAYTSTLVAKLAYKHHCRIVICYSLRNHGNRFDSYYYEAPEELYNSNEKLATQALNQYIERLVAQTPEQYLWSYKRFKRPAAGDEYPY